MNTLIIIWLAINAIIALPVLGFAVYCRIQDLRSKQSSLAHKSHRQTNLASVLELRHARV